MIVYSTVLEPDVLDSKCDNSSILMDTGTEMPNRVVGRYVPSSLARGVRNTHSVLRYAPEELRMVNLDTTNDASWTRTRKDN